MSSTFSNINSSYIWEANEYLLRPLTDNPSFQELGFRVYQTPHTSIRPVIYFPADSKVSKAYAPGWTGSTAPTLKQKLITLAEFKAERDWDKHELEGTIAYMDANRQDNNIFTGDPLSDGLLNQFNSAIMNDITRYVWLGDTAKVNIVSGTPVSSSPDLDYNVIDGLWTCFFDDASTLADGSASVLAAGDQITRTIIANGTTAQQSTASLASMTAGTMGVTVNGVEYTEAFDTSVNTTVANWLASHKVTIEAANQFGSVDTITVTAATNVITVDSDIAGMPFSLIGSDGGTNGVWTDATPVANVGAAALGADEAKATLRAMYENAPKQLRSFIVKNPGQVAFYVTCSLYDNYLATLQDLGATESSYMDLTSGKRVLTFNGIPLINMPQWDVDLADDFVSPFPHRAVLTYSSNLQVALRKLDTFGSLEFDNDFRNNELLGRAQYYMGTGYALPEHIAIAM